MTNTKKYNIFITITSFTKLLIEVFTPLLLFKMGFEVKEILLFLLTMFITILITAVPIAHLGNIINFKKLIIISSFFFSATYLYINFMSKELYKLIILGILNGLYLITYWLSRHIFGISIIEDKKTTDNVSLYTIFATLGSLPASYIGAKILNNFGFITLSIIILILSLISIIPLTKIKTELHPTKLNIKKIIKTYPIKNYLFYFLEQFRYLGITLFPLYIFININEKLEYIGISYFFIGLSSIIYIYFLSKKMDKNKKSYLKPMLLFYSFIFLIKLNVKKELLLLLVIFIEGISKSALDTIILRNTYSYSKNYDPTSYMTFIEMIYSFFRIIIVTFFIILNVDLTKILYICLIAIFLNSFINFKEGKNGYQKNNQN